jgi:hypothetical protein
MNSRSLAESGLISISYDKTNINISKYILRNIWQAAAELIQNSEKAIYPAPCLTEGVVKFSVLSSMRCQQDSQKVTIYEDSGILSCVCKYYDVHTICSHVVACAEINDRLKQFLTWHYESGKCTNKHKQSTQNINLRCVGQKGNQPRRRRNTSKETDSSRLNTNNRTVTPEQCKQLDLHDKQFILKQLHGTQIRKCYGCGKSIRTPPAVPPIPFDFVLAAKVMYSFSHPKTGVLVVKKDWKHFHLKRACVTEYISQLGVHVCNLIKPKLSPVHFDHIKNEFGI